MTYAILFTESDELVFFNSEGERDKYAAMITNNFEDDCYLGKDNSGDPASPIDYMMIEE